MIRLSIIVPMYNVEPYVEKCLRSLEDQDIPKEEYEIICINDGSPDNCREVVLGMQKEFDNIVLIDQENQGVSRARNNGIDIAKGKYVLFIDPDDYVDSKSFDRILKNIDKQKAQVSFLGFTVLNENGTIRSQVFNENNTIHTYPGTESYFTMRNDGRLDPDRIYAVIFETCFLNRNNLRFLPAVPYLEDGEFIARILCLSDRCIFEEGSFYQRTTRPGSATQSNLFNSEKATNGFFLAASNLKNFQQNYNLNNKQREFLNQPIAKFVLLAVNSTLSRGLYKNFLVIIKTLKTSGFQRIKLKGCDRSYRVFGKAYNYSPYIGAIALIIYPKMQRFSKLFNPSRVARKKR